MPFLLETRLTELGTEFVTTENFQEHVVQDSNLITGQNPASSTAVVTAIIATL